MGNVFCFFLLLVLDMLDEIVLFECHVSKDVCLQVINIFSESFGRVRFHKHRYVHLRPCRTERMALKHRFSVPPAAIAGLMWHTHLDPQMLKISSNYGQAWALCF